MMTVAAARLLWNRCVCFVGIGLPSAAAPSTSSGAPSPVNVGRLLRTATTYASMVPSSRQATKFG